MPWVGRIVLDLLAKPFDVRVEGSRVREFQAPPERVETDLAGHHLAQASREEREQVELLAAEFDLATAPGHRAPNEVESQVAEADHLGFVDRDRTTQHRADSSDEFTKTIGL